MRRLARLAHPALTTDTCMAERTPRHEFQMRLLRHGKLRLGQNRQEARSRKSELQVVHADFPDQYQLYVFFFLSFHTVIFQKTDD